MCGAHKHITSAAVLLLCAVGLLGFDGTCESSREISCFQTADYMNYMNTSRSVIFYICPGKKLNISMERLPGDPICQWSRRMDPVPIVNGSHFMVLPPLLEKDSGDYILSCESQTGSRSLLLVSLFFEMRPTVPHLKLTKVNEPDISPVFQCTSEGCPTPTIQWAGNYERRKAPEPSGSTISSSRYSNKAVMCCAANAEGEGCTQLYDYELGNNILTNNEVSNVTVSPGQTVLLRCRFKKYQPPHPVWERRGETLDATRFGCNDNIKKEICIKNDSHGGYQMAYLFIESLGVKHSGMYTCRTPGNEMKSVHINVSGKSILSVQLNDTHTVLTTNVDSSCLQARLSYHPALQRCTWEAPDEQKRKCKEESWVTKQRTVMLCGQLKTGEYKLHVLAGGREETKVMSVCVADEPHFQCSFNNIGDDFTCETSSPVPATYYWMSRSSSNNSWNADSNWEMLPKSSQTDFDQSCNKTIKSSLSTKLAASQLKFCLTNSLGSWCSDPMYVRPTEPKPYRGVSDQTEDDLMVLKVGSLFLLLALTAVSLVLVYFVSKKKPKYQPQLQMIQMVGPNDNDYIYINFKDFQYDKKWEFPRENLELGKELGSGAFGMVIQATAYGINSPGVSHQVAVKMLKEKYQAAEKEALMSELKMLTHIGQHVNIVNLLGACTDSGPIYLIFQYCYYGDLQNYLKNNSVRYHKSVTDAFNNDRFSNLYHNLQSSKGSSERETSVDPYVPMFSCVTRGHENIALLTLSSSTMDGYEDPEIYEEPEDQTDLQALTFDDLLSFAYQVAKGMEFLSSKNCIHRDLAARNVLVTKGRLVKIGDFGLARNIDSDSNYVVRGNVRLPVKWMAPESIFQRTYTVQSDVWAYGVLLWEIFSLGVTPYPGMKVDQKFYSMIERGFRMECPYYSNDTVYAMMCDCWALEPHNRPSFSTLVAFMAKQLNDREEKLYHNTIDQISTDHHNEAAVLDIEALTKQNENKSQQANEYCQTKTSVVESDTVTDEDKYLKSPSTERSPATECMEP
ncbi:receptor-type tyrosine-protein kinase FLT3 [Thalassophryne amazonica]|uniref:receptor-type tyrosine-protein kinase FLT3 n=1 Tax=Thalassophryne amazonica TaxID=390379 RepID=UPI001470DF31|nr:receptor-type tyrosine-protein kinase FLT3 [Thalassophryne amazonica]